MQTKRCTETRGELLVGLLVRRQRAAKAITSLERQNRHLRQQTGIEIVTGELPVNLPVTCQWHRVLLGLNAF